MTKSGKAKKQDLSVVILNYNTKKVLKNCLQSIKSLKTDLKLQVIVVDNNSSDRSVEMVRKGFKNYKVIENKENLGFARGNNSARKHVNSDVVLFLNSDTLVHENSFSLPLEYLLSNDDVAAVTVKTVLPNGQYDPDMRRRFPTPLVSLKHFSGLSASYRYKDISAETLHEIDVAQGAFLMVKKSTLDKVDWFDEDYFLDGEDVDLCWKIKQTGKKIIYFPDAYITHIKKASKKKDRKKTEKSVTRGVDAMRIFYSKRLEKKYPAMVSKIVYLGIDALKSARLFKYKLGL